MPSIAKGVVDSSERQAIHDDLVGWDTQQEHRTGTLGDLQTSQYLTERLRSSAVVPLTVETAMTRRVPQDCSIESDSFRLEGIPLFDCLSTPEQGIEGELCPVGSEGDIACGVVSSTGLGSEGQALMRHRTDGKYSALIGISENQTPGIAMINGDSFTEPFGLPTILVDSRSAQPLQEALERRERVRVRVRFEEQKALATNVELGVLGSSPKLAPVVVMTPKSSWWTSTAERGGGIAAWLACIRAMAESRPLRTVLFTANSGHELGHTGLHSYLRRHPNLVRGAHAWVHLGANLGATDSDLRLQVSDATLEKLASQCLKDFDVQITALVSGETRPGGEARDLFDQGGRYVSMLGSNRLFHHPDDRLDTNVDLDQIARIRKSVVQLLGNLAN